MPAYLVAVYRCPNRANAEQVKANFDPGDFSVAEYDTEIHDTPPVVLAGLVRGGEIRTEEEWENSLGNADDDTLHVDSNGRVLRSDEDFDRAVARGALPITWYTYRRSPDWKPEE
jgi:hypothetical protein